VQQNYIQNMEKNQNIDNIMGIIFLPKNPLFFKNQPFYIKKLCGVSILERNINILIKNGIRDIFILSESSVDFNNEMNFDSKKSVRIIKISELHHVKEHLNQIIFIKGNSIYSNHTDKNRSNVLGGKINLRSNEYLFEKKIGSFHDFFNSLIFNKSIYHSSDEISTYKPDMRRDVPLYIYSFRDYQDFKSAKKFLVKKTQKGTLDLIAWYFNRPFENMFVSIFADTKITANHITILVNILGYFVVFLFLIQYWWIGLFLLILVNILDGVDGKLARLKNQESTVGHIEHSFDQLYEQAIYVGIGLASYFIIDLFFVIIVLIIMLLSDSFNRHCSMQYKEVMKITLADSSKFDQLFRKFDGRRNIYTLHILIFGIFGHFKFVIFSICIHAIITSIIYSIQAIKHMKKVDNLNINKITKTFEEGHFNE